MTNKPDPSQQDLRLVVIGTSAGGLEALLNFLPHLPEDFPAAVLIVQHLPSEANVPVILRALQRKAAMACRIAEHEETIEAGYIYLPPADQHLLVKGQVLQLSRGARENRWRPGIDPLFRSAAVAFGPAVTGVILTGLLDDGTAGMLAIKRCGGTVVVQDPSDAQFPDMVQHVLNNVQVDHKVPVSEMAALLVKLVKQPLGPVMPVPKELQLEMEIAGRMLTPPAVLKELGEFSGFTCPDCGGPLAEVTDEQNPRFRCYTGHTFAAHTLLHAQAEELEEAMWMSVRMLEERRNMYMLMAQRGEGGSNPQATKAMEEKVQQAEKYIQRLREVLLNMKADIDGEKIS